MIAKFCSSIGINQSKLADWLGISRFAISRMASSNTLGKNATQQILDAFFHLWLQIGKEAAPLPDTSTEKVIQMGIKRLELEKQLLSKKMARQDVAERKEKLARQLAWLGQICLSPQMLRFPSVLTKLDSDFKERKKEWVQLDLLGEEFAEMELRHLNEKIILLQALENKEIKK